MKKVLSSNETARVLGISRTTLYRLPAKDIRKIHLTPKRVGWPVSEIERFIAERLEQAKT